jgi:hypothetical protein
MPKDNSELEEIVGLFRNDYWEEGKNRPYFRLYKRTGDSGSSKKIED